MELETALKLLANIVKKSEALDGANHLDFTLVSTEERPKYEAALTRVNFFIAKGDITKQEFQQRLAIG